MNTVRKRFQEIFSKTPMMVSSPGRVNLIGEHTDYNEGFVLPAAVDKKMFVGISLNDSDNVNAYANEYEELFSFSLHDIKPQKTEGWRSYILGVVYFLQQKGCEVKGVDVLIDGDVPVGAGMSSSAALCSAFGFALNEMFGFSLSRVDLAYIGQKTEHVFSGAMVGIMDQFASLHGKSGHVIRLDCRSMEYQYIPFNFPDYKIVMVNSMVKHSLEGTEYNTRREECQQGVEILKKYAAGDVRSLRDISLDLVKAHENDLGEEVFRRCLYVVTENERLLKGCKLLEAGNLPAFGELMFETHQGLSKLYEVSCEELDFLAEHAHTFQGVAGTRMMGGGFGGCTINLVKEEAVESFSSFIREKYREKFQIEPEIYITQIEDGTKIEE